MRPVIASLRSHPLLAGAAALLLVGLGIFVLVFFQPQKLLIDNRVDEAVPVPGPSASPSPEASPEQGPTQLASARFRALEHETSGEALVTRGADGTRTLSLVDFETSNGPDLRVYLSAGDDDRAFGKQYGEDFVELGKLKGNIGDQNYAIPADVDLGKYRNAVIWCKRFSVGFGVATF